MEGAGDRELADDCSLSLRVMVDQAPPLSGRLDGWQLQGETSTIVSLPGDRYELYRYGELRPFRMVWHQVNEKNSRSDTMSNSSNAAGDG